MPAAETAGFTLIENRVHELVAQSGHTLTIGLVVSAAVTLWSSATGTKAMLSALNMAYVAAGRFDAYYAFDNHVWDVAGGMVLVREAGGVITNVDGSPYDPYTPDALAAGPALHPVLCEAFRRANAE